MFERKTLEQIQAVVEPQPQEDKRTRQRISHFSLLGEFRERKNVQEQNKTS